MTSLCLFAARGPEASCDARCWVAALSREYDRVVVLLAMDHPGAASDPDCSWLPANASLEAVENRGLDFGMWARFARGVGVPPETEVLALVNDSCVLLGTDAPRAPRRPGVAWGLTKSHEISEHLQGFHVVLPSRAAVAACVEYLVRVVAPVLLDAAEPPSREDVIHVGEVGLSRHLVRSGLRLEAAYESVSGDPSFSHWDKLLRLGCPVLKRKRRVL